MRRSRSLSNIPVPHNAKRDSKSKRAKSTLRNSRDQSLDGQTPLVHRLGTHTPLAYRLGAEWSDQKYKLLKNVTPIAYSSYKRSGSVTSFGSRVSLTNTRSPLEKKAVQKLINDKKWVAGQYTKVQNFIQTSGLFNPELSGMIRPPTINIIVELFSVLFGQLIKTDPINSQNYADLALKTLKLLNYPGSITLSTLKTELLDLSSMNNAFKEQQDEELRQMFNLQDSNLEFLTTQYSIYTDSQGRIDKNLSIESEEELYHNMFLIAGIDSEAVQNSEQPLKTCRAEVAELEAKLQEFTPEIEKLQAQILERRDIIKKFKERNTDIEEDLEAELSQLRKLYHKQAETKKKLELSNKDLELIVDSQSCRLYEKNKMLCQIEDLKRSIIRKEGTIAEYRAVRDQLDHKLTDMIKEIEAKVDAWNVSRAKTLLPELQNLRLRGKGFHAKDFIVELKELVENKDEIIKQLEQEFQTIKSRIEKLRKRRESLVQNNKALNETKEKLNILKSSLEISKEEKRKILLKIDEVKKQFSTSIMEKEHIEGLKTKEAEAKIAELDEKLQKVIEKIDKSSKKGIAILMEADNLAVKNMQKINEATLSMVQDITKQAEHSKKNLSDIYNVLLSLQEKYAELP